MADISVEELKQRMDAGEKLHIIDVREAWEYDEFNIGAQLVPLGELQMKVEDLEEIRNEEIIMHCRSGSRSAAATSYLTGLGFTNVRNLAGGMIAWKQALVS